MATRPSIDVHHVDCCANKEWGYDNDNDNRGGDDNVGDDIWLSAFHVLFSFEEI